MAEVKEATVFVPATIGNVGPGFDVLGLAVSGLGDEISVALVKGEAPAVEVHGRDSGLVPRDPAQNCAVISAKAMLGLLGIAAEPKVTICRALPFAGGLGASAASSVGGALGALTVSGRPFDRDLVLEAALAGEASVSGRHLDNIAPCLLGGLCIVLGCDPVQVTRVPVPTKLFATVVTPAVQIKTADARKVLPEMTSRGEWTRQMAHAATLVAGFSLGDTELIRQGLEDLFAEPRRSPLIPRFAEVKRAALETGALGCSISGAGPTVFALCDTLDRAQAAGGAMAKAFTPHEVSLHVGEIDNMGARVR